MTALLATVILAITYTKLDYLPDDPLAHPTNISPSTITVCIDPGHGGSAKGAVSYSGLLEKDINLMLANDIRYALTNAGFRVVMTREDDRDVDLFARPAVAIMNDCDLFVSVHHNAPGPGKDPLKVRYKSVYSWNPLGQRLADSIAGRWKCVSLHANFAVTRNPEIPSCLIEADFITHPDGECAAWDFARRPAIAAAIADGIADWVAGK